MLSLPYFSHHCRMCLRSAALNSAFGWEPLPCCCFLPFSQTGILGHRNCVPVFLCWKFSFSALSVWRSPVKLVFPPRHPLSSWQLFFGPGKLGNTCCTWITVQISIAITRCLSCNEVARALTKLGVHMPEGIVVWLCRVIQANMFFSEEQAGWKLGIWMWSASPAIYLQHAN